MRTIFPTALARPCSAPAVAMALLLAVVIGRIVLPCAQAQAPAADAPVESAEPADEKPVEQPNDKAAKYFSALSKRPEPGYLFDRFHDAWLDSGTTAGLEAFLKSRAETDGAARLLLATFHSKLGNDAEASQVLDRVLADDEKNPQAWLMKAQLQARALDYEAAVLSLEKAKAAEPEDELALDIAKLHGQCLLRSGRGDAALKLWAELVAARPEDEELREDVIDLQSAEGMVEEAVASLQALIDDTDDAYEKISRRMRLGDLYQRSGRRPDALGEYAACLEASGQGSWLEKEIVAQIAQVFRREDDVEGLKKYFADLSAKHPGRVSLLRERARIFAEMKLADEAIEVFEALLKQTPGDRVNREAFVDLLGRLEKHAEAAAQMAALVGLHPEDVELRAQLAMRWHAAGDSAAAVRAVDAYLEQAGDSEYAWLRATRMLEDFAEMDLADKRFVELVARLPDSVGAREAQAAFLHRRGQTEEAVAIWRKLAQQGGSVDVQRAARALSSRGQREAAYEVLQARVGEFPTDAAYLGQLIGEALAVEKAGEALPWVERRLAQVRDGADLREVLRQAVGVVAKLDDGDAYLGSLRASAGEGKASAAQVCLLSELLEQRGEYDAAQAALAPLVATGDPLAIGQQVRLHELRDQWAEAAAVQLTLVEKDDNPAGEAGARSADLQKLVELYARASDTEAALTWIEEWKRRSPGSTQPWIQQSALLADAQRDDEAVAVLKAAAQRFDDSVELREALASRYYRSGLLADAERIYWRLYDDSEDLGQKLGRASELANIARARGKLDHLIVQFEERRRNNPTSVVPLLAMAEIYRRDNDYERRREALLEATRLRPEDLKLLQQIARIEEEEGDWERSLATLVSAQALDSTQGTAEKIARLHLLYGDQETGLRMIEQLAGGSDAIEADTVLGLADSLIAQAGWAYVREFLDRHIGRFGDDYRLHYLYAVALEEDGDPAARAAFLGLLDWPTELPAVLKSQSQRTVSAASAAGSTKEWYGDLPEGASDISSMQNASYQAFQHRQRLQQGRYVSSYSSLGSGRIVTPPGNKEQAGQFALTHLHSLLQFAGDEDRATMVEEMSAHGIERAEQRMLMPFHDFNSGNQEAPFPREMFERWPEDPAVYAAAVLSQMSPIQRRPQQIEAEMMRRCYDRLKDGYPEIALAAGLYAAASGDPEGTALALKAIDEAPEIVDWCDHSTFVMSQLLYDRYQNGMAKTDPALREKIGGWLLSQREKQLAKAIEANNVTTLAQSFEPDDPFLLGAYTSGDYERWLTFAESEIERYDKLAERLGDGRIADLFQHYSWAVSRSPLLGKLEFPPFELTGFPANVLRCFAGVPDYYPAPPVADFGKIEAALEATKDPLLRILLAKAADSEKLPEYVAAWLKPHVAEPRPAIKVIMMAAAWHGSTEEHVEAIQWLQKARLYPLEKSLRQRLDGALVWYAQQLDSDAATSADALAAGREAALRLRYGMLSPEKRGELVAALQVLGLDKEADRLAAKAVAAATASSSSSMIVRSSAAAQTPLDQRREKINELTGSGKSDEARDLLAETLRAEFRPVVSATNSTVNIDWNVTQFMLRFDAEKIAAAVATFEPKDETANDANAWLEYAALEMATGQFKPAISAYQRSFDLSGESKKPNVHHLRQALLIALDDPAAAVQRLEGCDDRLVSALPACFEEVFDRISSSGREQSRDRHFQFSVAMAEVVERLLDSTDADQMSKRGLDALASAVDGKLVRYSRTSEFSLPNLFYAPGEVLAYIADYFGNDEAKVVVAKRLTALRRLWLARMKMPSDARSAFGEMITVEMAHAQEPSGEEPVSEARWQEWQQLASEIIAAAGNNRAGAGQMQQRYGYSDERRYLPVWTPETWLLHRIWKKSGEAGRAEAQEVVAAAGKIRSAGVRELAQGFFDLLYCAPANYFEKADKYLTAAPRHAPAAGRLDSLFARNQGEIVLQIWRERKLADAVDFSQWLIEREASSQVAKREISDAADAWFVHLSESGEISEAEAFLEQMALSRIGEKSEWEKFVRSPDQNSPQGSWVEGTYPDARMVSFAKFADRVGSSPTGGLVLAGFAQRNGIDDGQQISSDTFVSRIFNKAASLARDELRKLLRASPFTQDTEGFCVVSTDNEGSALRTFVSNMQSRKKVDVALAALDADGRDTFGTDLLRTCLSANAKPAMADFFRRRHNDFAKLDAAVRDDLFKVIEWRHPEVFTVAEVGPEAMALVAELEAGRSGEILERVDKFLAFKKVADTGCKDENEFNPYVHEMLDALIFARDWDKAVRVFWHASDLVKDRQRQQNWYPHWNGWSYEADSYDDYLDDAPNPHLGRLALMVRLLRGDTAGRAPHSGWTKARVLNEDFKKRGGGAKLEANLTSMFADLADMAGEGPVSILALPLYGFFDGLPPAQQRRAIDWADQNSQGQAFSPIAKELAMAARLHLSSPYKKSPASVGKDLADADGWRGHYRAVIENTTLPLTWRFACAHFVTYEAAHRIDSSPELVRAGMALTADILQSDAWFNGWNLLSVTGAACRLPKDEAWMQTAARWIVGWQYKNRNNFKNHNTGEAFDPNEEAVLAALELHLRHGDPKLIEKFRATKQHAEAIAGDSRSLLTHVVQGDYEGATSELMRSRASFDLGSYTGARNRFAPRFDPEVATAMGEYLKTVEDSDLHFLAETLLSMAPDLPNEQLDGKPLATDPRLKRANQLAERFQKTEFSQPAIRQQVLEQLVFEPGTAWFLRKELAGMDHAKIIDGLVGNGGPDFGGRNPNTQARLLVAHVLNEARSEAGKSVTVIGEFVAAVLGENPALAGYNHQRVLDLVVAPLLDTVRKRQLLANEAERWNLAQVIAQLVAALPAGNSLSLEAEAQTQLLICASLAGKMPEAAELRAGFAKPAFSGLRNEAQTATKVIAQLAQSLRVQAPEDRRPPIEQRRLILSDVLADEAGRIGLKARGRDLFATLVKARLLTEDEQAGELGSALAEAWPRNGWAAYELAVLHQRQGDVTQTEKWRKLAFEQAPENTPHGKEFRKLLSSESTK